MMLHKIFHLNNSAEETRERLFNIGSYRHHLDGVERADFTGHGISHWSVLLPLGFKADFVLTEEVSEDRNAVVFKSLDGDFEIMGLIKFHSIKAQLTEVELVVNYESTSRAFNLLDRMFNLGDYFMLNQLRRVRAHFEGIAAPVGPREVVHYGHELMAA